MLLSLSIMILLLVRMNSSQVSGSDPSECYTKEYFIKQYVNTEVGALNLTILTSSRSSHNIISHILHILLKQSLGYQEVAIISEEDESSKSPKLALVGKNSGKSSVKIPPYMVNMEVWLPPGLSHDNLNGSSSTFSTAGPLGPVTQYGWFLRNATLDAFWSSRNKPIDHYRYWTDASVTRHFQLYKDKVNDNANLIIPNDLPMHSNVIKSAEELIQEMKLKVDLPNHKSRKLSSEQLIDMMTNLSRMTAEEITTRRNNLLLFSWLPNVVTSRIPVQRVSFSAPCSLSFNNGVMEPQVKGHAPCDPFPIIQLTKWVWNELKTSAPMAYSLIRNMSLSQTVFEDILRMVNVSNTVENKDDMYRKVACKWIKENRVTWEKWLPERPKKVKMLIGGMFPIKEGRWYDADLLKGGREGIRIANEVVLKDCPYEIVMEVHNISCDKQDEALYHYNQIVLDKCGRTRGYLLGILAASCSASIEPMILLNQHYRSVIISPTVESEKLSKIDKYPFFFRTVPDMTLYSDYLSGTFEKMKWRRAALFRKDDHFVSKQSFKQDNIEIVDDFEMAEEQLDFNEVKHNLQKAKEDHNARIFVIEYFEEGTSIVLCAAAKLGMNASAGYVWFLNPWIGDNFLTKPSVKKHYTQKKNGGCTLDEMLKTIGIYFVLTHLTTPYQEERTIESKYYPYVKDAVLVFAHALRTLADNDTRNLSQLNDPIVSKQWLKAIANTSFDRAGNKVQFNERNTRPSTMIPYMLMEYVCSAKDKNCSARLIGMWKRRTVNSTSNDSYFFNRGSGCEKCDDEYWIDDEKPSDGARKHINCFWPSLADEVGSCLGAVFVVVAIVIVCILAICFILGLAIRPHYLQLKEAKRQLAPFSDILNDLQPLELKSSSQIVLNLPLGEGAFGTVRGGELKLDGQWHAVAVKTLHERATQEEKMEFLSEARIMKAFDHPNIVKLLGVRAQSKSEPYMTVMEFMLYGDMKKYLIARHVLAKEEPQHADISPESLTSMTVDIVYGLRYLHNLGYIHRDLALRNCLVGNNRQVKLCDFGLTRKVNDGRDYYRFERRGMLPVRWMAPESLHSGVFTTKSDIWSFGVVLYEIVTFGNKPYRDKRNEDVIECMRNGNDCLIRYLNRPEENLPKLLTLMRECFHYYPHERPDSAHILNYLLSDPCCVRPCLEEVPPDPGELPAGLLGPDRRGGSGGGSTACTDRIRFHSGARGSTSTNVGIDSVFTYDQSSAAPGLAQHSGLNSSFPPLSSIAVRNTPHNSTVNGARNSTISTAPGTCNDVRNYASTELIPMRSTSMSAGLGEENSPDNASPTTGLLETEISIGSDVDALAACDYDTPAVTYSPFANGATPHSRASMGLGSSLGSLHSRLTHAS